VLVAVQMSETLPRAREANPFFVAGAEAASVIDDIAHEHLAVAPD